MIASTREERRWLLRVLAQGLVNYMGIAQPPVEVEELVAHPPEVFARDLGVVETCSKLWDATYARPLGRRGRIFVQMDLPPEKRRFVLARELLTALITSRHGRAMGLFQLFIDDLNNSAEYFARMLLVPETMKSAYKAGKGAETAFAGAFRIPPQIAAKRWSDPDFFWP